MKIKLLGAAAVVLGVGMAMAPMGVRAAEADVDGVVFVSSVASANVCWVLNTCGSTQTYTFTTSGGTCEFASADAPSETLPDAELGGCSITSSGSFSNIVCGTGTVSGAATTIAEPGSDTYNVAGYTIVFAGGIGVLVAPSVTESAADDGPVPGVAAGVVDISPNGLQAPVANPNNPGLCTTGFSVASALVTNA